MALELKLDAVRLAAALQQAREELLAERNAQGHWAGELSSSALSSATAVTALSVVGRETATQDSLPAIERGLAWLAQHQNADGGWGDTVLSHSNLSTTTLGWAAFGAVPGADDRYRRTVEAAQRWIRERVGGLDRAPLSAAIIRRYGVDRTFSVPILTMCALAGRLGAGREAWEAVIPLPFELAAFPRSWFAALQFPVVSYALPALIAIGQVRHLQAPSRNPLARCIRDLARARTLRVLAEIQPGNGGFLEATPLTSFVTMSLAGSGLAGHPVARKGIGFLLNSQRTDGSWPIDTNLATWVTTLSVNALGFADAVRHPFTPSLQPILKWLLDQQYRVRHPYTDAPPGGWAWTDLPGGVPDADDTPGALLALKLLGGGGEALVREAAVAGIEWLLDLQNRDGGIPTFCRGWGTLPFDRSSADLTAHAVRAWLAWFPELSPKLQRRVGAGIKRALQFLRQTQRPDGSWVPLWFGNQHDAAEENPSYGTSRVVTALSEVLLAPATRSQGVGSVAALLPMFQRATKWLADAQGGDGGWGGFPGGPPSVEETALALESLAHAVESVRGSGLQGVDVSQASASVARGADWLMGRVESGEWRRPSPIGFYFARLWYYERLYPLIFTVGALGRVERLRRA